MHDSASARATVHVEVLLEISWQGFFMDKKCTQEFINKLETLCFRAKPQHQNRCFFFVGVHLHHPTLTQFPGPLAVCEPGHPPCAVVPAVHIE